MASLRTGVLEKNVLVIEIAKKQQISPWNVDICFAKAVLYVKIVVFGQIVKEHVHNQESIVTTYVYTCCVLAVLFLEITRLMCAILFVQWIINQIMVDCRKHSQMAVDCRANQRYCSCKQDILSHTSRLTTSCHNNSLCCFCVFVFFCGTVMIRTCCTQEHMNFSWLVTLAPCSLSKWEETKMWWSGRCCWRVGTQH